jgi:hypothetical protein
LRSNFFKEIYTFLKEQLPGGEMDQAVPCKKGLGMP